MRAIFFSLVALNICLFVWGFMFSSPSPANASSMSSRSPVISGLPSLELLSEMDNVEARGDESGAESSSRSGGLSPSADTSSVQPDRPLCEMVGAFKNRSAAENFIERLKAIELTGALKELELPAGPGYWVYLPPEQTRREALRRLSELQSRGVDSYVIPKGDIENGISLGMFSQKNLADMRMKEMKAIGLEPKLEIIERTYREMWVMLKHGEHKKMSEITWNRLLDGIDHIERRQNFCLDVASEDNFH